MTVFRYWFYCEKWHLGQLPVDEVYGSIIEEISAALMPSEEEEMLVKTEEDEQASYWRVMDVDYGIAHCVSIDSEKQETVLLVFVGGSNFLLSSISAICISSSPETTIS